MSDKHKSDVNIEALLTASKADTRADKAFNDKLLALAMQPQRPERGDKFTSLGWIDWLFARGALRRPVGAMALMLSVGIALGAVTAPAEQQDYDLSTASIFASGDSEDGIWSLDEEA